MRIFALFLTLAALLPAAGQAQTLSEQMQACAGMANAAQRLDCYDGVARSNPLAPDRPSAAQLPRFADFPATAGPPAQNAPLRLEQDVPTETLSRLRAAAAQSPNFAGHYRLVILDCGSRCLGGAIIDALDGRVVALPATLCCLPTGSGPRMAPIEYRPDSRLLILHGVRNGADGDLGTHYYRIEEPWGFRLLRSVPLQRAAAPAALPPAGRAQILSDRIEACAGIRGAIQRLGCYDDVVRTDPAGSGRSPAARLPRFSDFPATAGPPARNAPIRLTRADMLFRTRLRAAARERPDFAGHYVLVYWGCGTDCRDGAVIDTLNGRVTWLPSTICCMDLTDAIDPRDADSTDGAEDVSLVEPIVYRADSRLLILNGWRGELEGDRGAHYYRIENGRFVHVADAPIEAAATDP